MGAYGVLCVVVLSLLHVVPRILFVVVVLDVTELVVTEWVIQFGRPVFDNVPVIVVQSLLAPAPLF